jgi:hypothetical protein
MHLHMCVQLILCKCTGSNFFFFKEVVKLLSSHRVFLKARGSSAIVVVLLPQSARSAVRSPLRITPVLTVVAGL